MHLGCYNNNSIKWVAYNNTHLFLPVLEVEKSKIKVLVESVSSENPLSGVTSFPVSLNGGRGELALCGLFL